MTEATIAAPASGAAPVVARIVSPAPAPPAPAFGGSGSVPSSTVDPGKFPIREDYAAALLKEKLTAIHGEPGQVPAADEQPAPGDEAIAVADPSEPSPEAHEVP